MGGQKGVKPTHIITIGYYEENYGEPLGVITIIGYDCDLVGDISPNSYPYFSGLVTTYETISLFYTVYSSYLGSYTEIRNIQKVYFIRLDKRVDVHGRDKLAGSNQFNAEFFTEEDVGKNIPLYISQDEPSFEWKNLITQV